MQLYDFVTHPLYDGIFRIIEIKDGVINAEKRPSTLTRSVLRVEDTANRFQEITEWPTQQPTESTEK